MNKNDLFLAFNDVDDDILERSEADVSRRKAPVYLKWCGLAACMALVISLGSVAFVSEAKEYNEALDFFAENGLSTEGLSRWDVKAIYQDITTKRFTYDKTAIVLEQAVPGVEIAQREPTPEELAALWEKNLWSNTQQLDSGIRYSVDYRYKPDETLGFDVLDKSILECYRDGEQIWTVEFDDFCIDSSKFTSAGTLVWGNNYTWSSEQPIYSYIALVDEKGSILWQRRLDHGFKYEYVSQMLDNGDGTLAAISRGDIEYLCLSQYDMEGKELSFSKNETGNYGIWNAVRLGDGYLVQLGNSSVGENARLVKLSRDGSLLDSFTYEGEDCDYYITHMAEFSGKVYLSSYAVPKQTDEGGRDEIANILDYVFKKDNWEVSSEELTPIVRDNYTAVLLLCDPEGGQPETFYSVKGSMGGELSVNEAGELQWDVESIASTFFSPATNSFTIGGTCQLFRYTFDAAGNILDQEDTGETVPYRR